MYFYINHIKKNVSNGVSDTSEAEKNLYERYKDIKNFAHKLCLFNMTHIRALREYLKLCRRPKGAHW
jgi:hypothetical protein